MFPKWKPFPFDLDTNPRKVSKLIGNWIQTKWKPFPFCKHVSKSNGNGFDFGNSFQITRTPLLPFWILPQDGDVRLERTLHIKLMNAVSFFLSLTTESLCNLLVYCCLLNGDRIVVILLVTSYISFPASEEI